MGEEDEDGGDKMGLVVVAVVGLGILDVSFFNVVELVLLRRLLAVVVPDLLKLLRYFSWVCLARSAFTGRESHRSQ